MPLPVVAMFPWLVGLLASALSAAFTWAVSFFAGRLAIRFALTVTYLVTLGALTVGVAVLVKGLIIGIQVSMPTSLGASTYFLPSNINVIMGAYFSMRVAFKLYCWTVYRLKAIAQIAATA